MTMTMIDAPIALGHVLSQRTHIEREVMQKPYPEFKYARLIPLDFSANEYASSVTFFSRDTVGAAKIINAKGDDIPFVSNTLSKHEFSIMDGAIAAAWSIFEIGAARQMGMNLQTDDLDAARAMYERMIDDIAFIGNSTASVEGLFNTTGVTSTAAAAVWAGATSKAIVDQVTGLFSAIRTDTLDIDTADTLILPIAQHTLIETTAFGVEGGVTIAEYLRKNLSALMGKPISIESDYRLTSKAVVYKRSPDALKLHIPMSLRFLPPEATNLQIKMIGVYRFSALNIRKLKTIRYLTGI